jgi:hypothetical protein
MEWKRGRLLIVSSAIWAQHFVTTVVDTLSPCCVHTDAACPLLVCSDFITFFQWCFCVSNFGSQFCQYVTAIDHLSLPLFPHLPIILFASVSFNNTSYGFNFPCLFANTFVLVCNFTFFFDVTLGCTHEGTNIVLRKAWHPKREREREVIGSWWRLHIGELQDLFSSLIISSIRVVRSRRMR